MGEWVNNSLLERCLNITDELSYDQALMSMGESKINLLTYYMAIGQIQYHTYNCGDQSCLQYCAKVMQTKFIERCCLFSRIFERFFMVFKVKNSRSFSKIRDSEI